MSGRDRKQARDPDDWFAELGPSQSRRSRRSLAGARDEDVLPAEPEDWLRSRDPGSARRARIGGLGAPFGGRLAVAAAALVVFLLIGLAVGGVFSGSPQRHTAPPRTTPATTQPTSTPSTAGTTRGPSATLKPGDVGAQVRALQRALASLGYSTGRVDGRYGPATQSAVSRFQHASGLAADGILGSRTLRALDRALKGR